MNTNQKFVSRVVGGLKALTKDGRISRRLVLNTGRDKVKFLMSQKLDEMSLFKEESIITNISCFKMERVEAKYCDVIEFRLCNKVSVSKNKLPEGLFGKNGSGIISVTNIDGSQSYDYITPRKYRGLTNRKYTIKNKRYYYTQDGRLYLPGEHTELVDVEIITLDKDWAKNLSECDRPEDAGCTSVWDSEFVCPDRFYDRVLTETIQELANVWRTSVKDENPNLDENQKTQTTK